MCRVWGTPGPGMGTTGLNRLVWDDLAWNSDVSRWVYWGEE